VDGLQACIEASEVKQASFVACSEESEASLRLLLQKSQAECTNLQEKVAFANEATQQIMARLEHTDGLFELLAARTSASESAVAALEAVNLSEMRARSYAEQELFNVQARCEEECKQLRAVAMADTTAQRELARVSKELIDCEIALQKASVEIASCHNEISARRTECENTTSEMKSLQQQQEDFCRHLKHLESELAAAKSLLQEEKEARLNAQFELSEVQDELHQFRQLCSSEVNCVRQALDSARMALASNDSIVTALQRDVINYRETLMQREKSFSGQISTTLVELEAVQAELITVKSAHQSEAHELQCQIEALKRDSFHLAELNYKSGVRVMELQDQLGQALSSLRMTESLLLSSEAFRNGEV
jgi:chromosome segregation ATPase